MKKYKFKINGNDYHVAIKETDGNMIFLELNGSAYEVEMEKEVKTTKTPTLVRPKTIKPEAPTEDMLKADIAVNKITAPLPGVILKVLVKAGDVVKRGDNLMVIEAMKMENTIQAEADGKIASVNVTDGQNVLQGETLLEIS